MDSLIASTAMAHGLVVVTRNVRFMERCGGKFCNLARMGAIQTREQEEYVLRCAP